MLKFYRNTILCFLIISAIVFTTCKKEENIIISGRITNVVDSSPIPNAKVILYENAVNSGSYNAMYSKISETFTDENGNYSFEIEQKVYVKFKIIIETDDYYLKNIEFFAEDGKTEYLKNILLARKSFLKVFVKNISPKLESDVLKLRIENINSECEQCDNGQFRYFNGANVDTTFIVNVVGGETVRIVWISIHNGESQNYNQNLYCVPEDTVVLNCIY
ncbi:MAG: carboxypeptidase-like regulatory domain-containing protein [Endomicrobiia bacterium]